MPKLWGVLKTNRLYLTVESVSQSIKTTFQILIHCLAESPSCTWLNPCCFWLELPQCSLWPHFEALLSSTDLFGSLFQSGCNVLLHVAGFFWPSAELVGAQPLAVCVTAAVLSFFCAFSYSSMLLSLLFCMPLLFSASRALYPSVTSPCFTRGEGRKPSSY